MWPWEGYPHTFFLLLQLPWIFMDGFFVLSGFLITGILLDSRARPDYYRSFYVRRAFRILPLYYVVLTIITAIAVLNGHTAYKEMQAHWGSPWWFFAYLGNIPTAMTGSWPLAAGGAFVPLWSLQVEEQFYLIFPLFVHKLRLESMKKALVALCCFSTALRFLFYWFHPENDLVQYVFLPCHLEGLAIGAWMAIRFRQGPWKVNKLRLAITAFSWSLVTVGLAIWDGCYDTHPFNRTFGFLLSPLAFGYVIFWMIQCRDSRATAWLRMPVLTNIGKVSYAAYLLHWLMANVLTIVCAKLHIGWFDVGFYRLAMIYVLTFAVSALSWRYFEKPVMRLRERFQSPKSVQVLGSLLVSQPPPSARIN